MGAFEPFLDEKFRFKFSELGEFDHRLLMRFSDSIVIKPQPLYEEIQRGSAFETVSFFTLHFY